MATSAVAFQNPAISKPLKNQRLVSDLAGTAQPARGLSAKLQEIFSGCQLIFTRLLDRQPIKLDWRSDRLVIWFPRVSRTP